MEQHGPRLPVYWGNRNWHPLLADTLRQMAGRRRSRALGFFTSAYSSYSGCRQYRENIAAAQAEVGAGAPQVDKLRAFFNHPGFIEPMIERTAAALSQIPEARRTRRSTDLHGAQHSAGDGRSSKYEAQLREACQLVAAGVGRRRLAVGLSKPQRPAVAALAGARH